MSLSREKQIEILRKMYLIRAFEEKAEQLYAMGKIHGTMHLSIGEEASAVGSVAALEPEDYILSTHRGHGHSIAKGADVRKMMAEFLGKETGYCRGRGGSMHIADVESGNLGANGVVAGGIPISIGVGISIKRQRLQRVVLTFFGDGAVAEGAFHEAMNMASIWKLPVVFVCENNQYAMSLPVKKAFATGQIADKAAPYGVPGIRVDGNDVMAVYKAVKEAVDRARRGEGPTLIENVTYRWRGHSKSDANRYRTREEIEKWKKKCPIKRYRKYLIDAGVLTEEEAERIEKEAYAAIEEAVVFAENSPEPSVDELEEGVYAP